MLLCVASGSNATSFAKRPISRDGTPMPFDSRAIFNGGKKIAAKETSVPSSPISSLMTLSDDLRQQHVTYRSKLLVVRDDDSTCEVANKNFKSTTTTTFKSSASNGVRNTNTVFVRYRPSKLDDSHGSNTEDSLSSSTYSVTCPVPSSRKNGVSTSAWAQIMELEGYRSPAVGLDTGQSSDSSSNSKKSHGGGGNSMHRNVQNITSSSCDSSKYSKSNDDIASGIDKPERYQRGKFTGSSSNSLSNDAKSSIISEIVYDDDDDDPTYGFCEKFADRSLGHTKKNSSNSYATVASAVVLHEDGLISAVNFDCYKAEPVVAQISPDLDASSGNMQIKRNPTTDHPLWSKNKTVTKRDTKLRRKTLNDGDLGLNGERQKTSAATVKHHSSMKNYRTPDQDPNASWGRYNSRAIRDSVRKIAEKYEQFTYGQRRAYVKSEMLPSLSEVSRECAVDTKPYYDNSNFIADKANVKSNNSCFSTGFIDKNVPVSLSVTSVLRDIGSSKSSIKPTYSKAESSLQNSFSKVKPKLCDTCAKSVDTEPPIKYPSLRSSYSSEGNNVYSLSQTDIHTSDSITKHQVKNLNENTQLSARENNFITYLTDAQNSKEIGLPKMAPFTELTAKELSELVNGTAPYTRSLNSDLKKSFGARNKVSNWLQRQKSKGKPVFFIGDKVEDRDKEKNNSQNVNSKRSVSLKDDRQCPKLGQKSSYKYSSISDLPGRERFRSDTDGEVASLTKEINGFRDVPSSSTTIRRAISSCGNNERVFSSPGPFSENPITTAKILAPSNNVKLSDTPVVRCASPFSSSSSSSTFSTGTLKRGSTSSDINCTISVRHTNSESKPSESFPDRSRLSQSKIATSDIAVSYVPSPENCPEVLKGDDSQDSYRKVNSGHCSLENTSSKADRSLLVKKLLNFGQISRALSLHSLKKKTKDTSPSVIQESVSSKSNKFLKLGRDSWKKKNSINNSNDISDNVGSLRKCLSFSELSSGATKPLPSAVSSLVLDSEPRQEEVKLSDVTTVPKQQKSTSNLHKCACFASFRRTASLPRWFPHRRQSRLLFSIDRNSCYVYHKPRRKCSLNSTTHNKRILDITQQHKLAPDQQNNTGEINDESRVESPSALRNYSSGSDANLLRKRAASTSDYSPKSKSVQRPLSVIDNVSLQNSSTYKILDEKHDLLRASCGRNQCDDLGTNYISLDHIWRSNPIKLCRVHSRLLMCRHKGRYRLRRSISQPVELESLSSITNLHETSQGYNEQENFHKGSSSDDDAASSDSDIYHSFCCSPTRRSNTCWELSTEGSIFAEALWDHETSDTEELPFQAGDLIEVTDTSDREWWWGTRAGRGGWFPAAFVRLYINHRGPSTNYNDQPSDDVQIPYSPTCKVSMNNLSCEQVRANIVQEIVATERDYVKHLKDVVEGYLKQVHKRTDMFNQDCINTVFGNIREIYEFQSQFLKKLEGCLQKDAIHLSQIGNCFLENKEKFKMYSEYCNNHPLAVSELQELYCNPQYVQFFEACRLLQEMIDISLDGFLLTPIQRICKYPLQLAELLKFTETSHPDHVPVTMALTAMKDVAELVNERKRRMECLERLTEWQSTIEGWEGPDVLDTSSILIHCGEVTRVSSSWSRDIYIFIFDHLLIYCKKDLLKRQTYAYKGRLNLDSCDIVDIDDGKDSQFAVNVKNAWKLYCKEKEKWYLFYAKTAPEKEQWLAAFKAERKRVADDMEQGFVVTEDAKRAARLAVQNKQKPKRPRAKFSKGRRCHPDVAVTELLLDPPSAKSRTGSLPSNIHPELAIMAGAKLGPPRKKGSGWFHFGSGKKPKS